MSDVLEQETNQSESSEKLTKISKKIARVERNEKGQLQPGSILNPEGLQKGTKHFSSIMDEAVEDIAKEEGISTAEVWKVLVKIAYDEAKNKNYPYFKDIFDRYYGKPKERLGLGIDDESIEGIEIKIISSFHNKENETST